MTKFDKFQKYEFLARFATNMTKIAELLDEFSHLLSTFGPPLKISAISEHSGLVDTLNTGSAKTEESHSSFLENVEIFRTRKNIRQTCFDKIRNAESSSFPEKS